MRQLTKLLPPPLRPQLLQRRLQRGAGHGWQELRRPHEGRQQRQQNSWRAQLRHFSPHRWRLQPLPQGQPWSWMVQRQQLLKQRPLHLISRTTREFGLFDETTAPGQCGATHLERMNRRQLQMEVQRGTSGKVPALLLGEAVLRDRACDKKNAHMAGSLGHPDHRRKCCTPFQRVQPDQKSKLQKNSVRNSRSEDISTFSVSLYKLKIQIDAANLLGWLLRLCK